MFKIRILIFLLLSLTYTVVLSQENCESSTNYLQDGLTNLENQEYVNAIFSFSCAIELEPENALYYHYRADANFLLGNYVAARLDYQTSTTFPNIETNLYFESLLYASISAIQIDQYEYAEQNLDIIIDSTDDIVSDEILYKALISRASIYESMEMYESALQDYNRVIEFSISRPIDFASRGFVHQSLDNEMEAFADWMNAVNLDNNVSTEYQFSAQTAIMDQDFQDALNSIEKAILLDELIGSPQWWSYTLRAIANLELDDDLQAIRDINFAMFLDEDQTLSRLPLVLIVRAEAYLNLDDTTLALNDVEQYFGLDIDFNPQAYLVRGNIFYEQENFEAALSDYLIFRDTFDIFDDEVQNRIQELQANSP